MVTVRVRVMGMHALSRERDVYQHTCAGQRAAQLPFFATLQRRRTIPPFLLITSLALETARGVGSRGQL